MQRGTMPLLSGVTVLELGTVAMAPYAGQWLADLGANVIKVEPPEGDSTRRIGPTPEENMGPMFLGLNRSKRSIVLDLKTEPAQHALMKLIDRADVLFHNTRPEKMNKLGIGPDVVVARNPRIVYANLHGYGMQGPYGGRPAYDDIIQGETGLAHLMGRQTGEPRYVPTVVADKTTGLFAVIGILAALNSRERSGKGVVLEVPMFESMVAFNAIEHLYGASFDPPLSEASYPRVMAAHRRPFATADGFICLLPYTDQHWRAFFNASGEPALGLDPRFQGIEARTKHIAELYQLASEIIKHRTTAHWIELCTECDIPCAPVRSIDDLIDDEHLKAIGFFNEFDDQNMGRVRLPGVPIVVNGARPKMSFPPRLGEHTRTILEEFGVESALVSEILAGNAALPAVAAE